MRRAILLLMVGALLLTMVPSVAFAADITCSTSSDRASGDPVCAGTEKSDTIREREGSKYDDIRAKGGNDTIRVTRAGNDRDDVNAGEGDDTIYADDGDTRDTIKCGPGTDTAIIDVVYEDPDDPTTPGDIEDSDKVYNCETVKDQEGNDVDELENQPQP